MLFHDASDAEIKLQRDHWRPWLSQYPAKRMYWNLPAGEQDDDAVRGATYGLLRISPCNVLDFQQHFVVFESFPDHAATRSESSSYTVQISPSSNSI